VSELTHGILHNVSSYACEIARSAMHKVPRVKNYLSKVPFSPAHLAKLQQMFRLEHLGYLPLYNMRFSALV